MPLTFKNLFSVLSNCSVSNNNVNLYHSEISLHEKKSRWEMLVSDRRDRCRSNTEEDLFNLFLQVCCKIPDIHAVIDRSVAAKKIVDVNDTVETTGTSEPSPRMDALAAELVWKDNKQPFFSQANTWVNQSWLRRLRS